MTRGEGPEVEEPAELDSPAMLRQLIEDTLNVMGEVTEETFYSLCGRLDTLENVHEVVAAYAAEEVARRGLDDGDADADDGGPGAGRLDS